MVSRNVSRRFRDKRILKIAKLTQNKNAKLCEIFCHMVCGTCETEGKLIGKVTHYYSNLGVAIIELEDALKVGDKIRIKGGTADFEQEVESMQIEHESIKEAKKGDVIGMQVKERAREGNLVYKL